jgi:hypothetical protein
MPPGQSILLSTAKLPIRHELIEQDHEAVAVSGLHKVDHFVHDEVFGTLRQFLTMSVLNRMLLRLVDCNFTSPRVDRLKCR